MLTGFHSGILFSFLLGITVTCAVGLIVDDYLYGEFLQVPGFFGFNHLKAYRFILALCPLDDFALVVDIGLDHLLKVEIRLDELVDDKFLATEITLSR